MGDHDTGGPVWPDRSLEAMKTQWSKGEFAFGMRPLAVGRYVLREMAEREIKRLRRAMKHADGRFPLDDWYCALGNVGFGVPQREGEPVTSEHMALMCEYLGIARVDRRTNKWSWERLLAGAFGLGSIGIVSRIYARAMGLEDAIIFHDVIGDEMRERLRAQRQVLIDSGFLAPVAYVRPALNRYSPVASEHREHEQMPLFGGIESAARKDGEGEG
jgi:hypothetical protein